MSPQTETAPPGTAQRPPDAHNPAAAAKQAADHDPILPPVISVIVPIFNEEEVIPELYRRMVAVLDGIGQPWELVCVNDGSRDQSLSMLLSLREQDARVKIINFSRNFGHQIAITAGMTTHWAAPSPSSTPTCRIHPS